MSAPARILGEKYQLLRPLSHGGMGSVWLAEHLSLAAPVAVKLIAPELGTSETFRQRFLREAHSAAALRSPHVVQTLDYGVDGETPYIVMELLEGESLAERLGHKGALSAQETELVLRHVSRAVARAHEQGIVHRDLKPANIFITRNDEEEVIKLFDFGIAKAMTEGADDAGGPTRTGSLLGTPAYMSPEQLEGSRDCDWRVDIWAMGVIAYECLLGKPPFVGSGLGGLVRAIAFEPRPVPSEQGRVPPGFDAWFARACARWPADRFSSAREAAQELRRVLTPEHGVVDVELPATIIDSTQPQLAMGGHEPCAGEVAFPLRPREALHTVPPASATISRSGRRPGRLRVASALVVAVGLLSLAGYRLWQPPSGLEQLVEGLAPLDHERQPQERARAQAAPAPVLAGAVAGAGPRPRPSTPVRVPQGDALRPPAATSPRKAEGATPTRSAVSHVTSATLTITSTPSSLVLIDGVPRGPTPLHSVRVRPGQHRVTLIYGKQRKTLYVETSAGENSLLSARFSEPEMMAAREPADGS